jgi:hypothetical protein
MVTDNQNPEQLARDQIDQLLVEADWHVLKERSGGF